MPLQFVAAQLGRRMHYAVPRILYRHGLLKAFFTDFCSSTWPGKALTGLPNKWLPPTVRRMKGRFIHDVDRARLHTSSMLGVRYAFAQRLARDPDESCRVSVDFGRRLCSRVVRSGVIRRGDAVFGYNSASLELLEYARRVGAFAVMEQTIAPKWIELDILARFAEKYPGWIGPTEAIGRSPGAAVSEFAQREQQEWANADLIICGSSFVKDGISRSGGPVDRCVVVPYGVDDRFQWVLRHFDGRRKLRVLTVGRLGLRKGAPILNEVAKATSHVCEFTAAGPVDLPADAARVLHMSKVQICGSLPQNELLELYQWADLLFLPSLCEGSATVTYEALCMGLPVLCSYSTGSQVTHGEDGWICNSNEPAEYVAVLHDLIRRPAAITAASERSRVTSRFLTENAYESRLISRLSSIV